MSDQGTDHNLKYEHLFDTAHLKEDLKNKAIRGGIWTSIGTAISYALRLGSIIILARMLMPEHFGLVGMVTALTLFAENFKDLGLSLATVQQKEINHEQVSALFWINAGIGALAAMVIAALSWPIAWFYHEPRLVDITLALSTGFFFGGLAVQHQALLRRQMHFKSLASVQLIANIMSIVLALGLAWGGYGHWALVWKEVSRNLFTAIGMFIKCPWMPALPRRTPGIGRMIRFGRDVSGFNMILLASRSIDQVLIGKFLGASALGYYRQAYQLMMLPMMQLFYPIQYVAEPAMSTLQHEATKYRDVYLRIVSLIAFVSMPLAVYLNVFSSEIIHLLFGQKWMPSAPIFQILCLALIVQPVLYSFAFVMVTSGLTKRYFMWGIVNAACTIGCVCIGIAWGATGIAAGYSFSMFLIFFISLSFTFQGTPITVSALLNTLLLPVLSSAMLAAFLVLVPREVLWINRPYGIASSLLFSVVVYGAVWMLLPGGKEKLLTHLSYPREILKNKTKVVG